jgi:hypothetical protein
LQAHFIFCTDTKPTQKKIKRACKPTHGDSSKYGQTEQHRTKKPSGNTGLAKVAVQCSADTFVVNQSLVLRINPAEMQDGENRHLRQAPKPLAVIK